MEDSTSTILSQQACTTANTIPLQLPATTNSTSKLTSPSPTTPTPVTRQIPQASQNPQLPPAQNQTK